MLKIKYEKSFKKDYKQIKKRGYNTKKFVEVLELLKNEIPLPIKYKDHKLNGDYKGFRECHIEPDWLLIYKVIEDELILILTRTGTHSDLF